MGDKAQSREYRYMSAYRTLKEQILQGQYPLHQLLPGENELAKTFGMERATIRKALALLAQEQLIEKKSGVGSKVIYSAAETAEQRSSRTIAFLLPAGKKGNARIDHPFYAALFYHVERACAARGYHLVYSMVTDINSFQLLHQNCPLSGVLFASEVPHAVIDYALALKLPCVLLNSFYDRVCSVLNDNYSGMYQACCHLIHLGHRQIGLLTGIPEYAAHRERLHGCLDALSEHQISIPDQYILETDWEFDSGYAAATRLLTGSGERPTAIAAFNDTIAWAAIRAANAMGLQVPGDVSVVGFDNLEQSRYTVPSLTTVDCDMAKLVDNGIRFLFQQMEEKEPNNIRVLIPVTLVERESAAPPPSSRPG